MIKKIICFVCIISCIFMLPGCKKDDRIVLNIYNVGDYIDLEVIEIFEREKGAKKQMCANVDLYSGLVYKMLEIPEELYTPLFAVARMAGWCAHRMEELYTGKRIIRPAYKAVTVNREYKTLEDR